MFKFFMLLILVYGGLHFSVPANGLIIKILSSFSPFKAKDFTSPSMANYALRSIDITEHAGYLSDRVIQIRKPCFEETCNSD